MSKNLRNGPCTSPKNLPIATAPQIVLGGVRHELPDQSRLIYLPSTSQQQNAHSSVVRQCVLFFRTNLNFKKKLWEWKGFNSEHLTIKHGGKKNTEHIDFYCLPVFRLNLGHPYCFSALCLLHSASAPSASEPACLSSRSSSAVSSSSSWFLLCS